MRNQQSDVNNANEARQPTVAANQRSPLRNFSLRRRITISIALLAVAAGAIQGGRWVVFNRTHAITDDAQVESDIYPVSARISGQVLRVLARTNKQVHGGQLLVEIDPTDYQVALQQAEAALAQAESSANAAAGTVNFTEQTGAAGISQASAQVAAAQAAELVSKRQGDSAAAQIQAARSDEVASAAAVEAAKHAIAAAAAALTSARAKADEAQKNAARIQKLLDSGAVSLQQRDEAVAASISAQANVEAAQAQVEAAQAALEQARAHHRQAVVAVGQAIQHAAAARAQVAQATASVRQAQAALKSAQSTPVQAGVRRFEARGALGRVAEAKARLEQAKLNLSYTRIVAPVDGMVANKNVEPGQFVQPGQPLIAIVAAGSNHITANFKETQLGKIKPGQRATFTVDAYPRVTFTGRVESISPGTGAVFSLLPPENASGNFTKVVQRVPVRIAIDAGGNPEHALRDGMSVVVSVDTR